MRIGGPDIPIRAVRSRARGHASGFSLPAGDDAAGMARGCLEAGASAATNAVSLLADGPGADGAVTDREARRHGQAVLDALAGLQLAQLGGDPRASLSGLADLAAAPRPASDPGLEEVLQAIAARAAVELARGR